MVPSTKNHPSTKQIGAKVIYEALKVLQEAGGELPGKKVTEQVAKRVTFTVWETERYEKSGKIRWQSILHFYTIDCTKAGFLRKQNGVWTITDEGKRALQNTPTELLEKANAGYHAWKGQSKGQESEERPGDTTNEAQKATIDLLKDQGKSQGDNRALLNVAVPLPKMRIRCVIKLSIYFVGVFLSIFFLTELGHFTTNMSNVGGLVGLIVGLGASVVSIFFFFYKGYHLPCLQLQAYAYGFLGTTGGLVVAVIIPAVILENPSTQQTLAIILSIIFLFYGASLVWIAHMKPSVRKQIKESVQGILQVIQEHQITTEALVTYLENKYALPEATLNLFLGEMKDIEQITLPGTAIKAYRLNLHPEVIDDIPQVPKLAPENPRPKQTQPHLITGNAPPPSPSKEVIPSPLEQHIAPSPASHPSPQPSVPTLPQPTSVSAREEKGTAMAITKNRTSDGGAGKEPKVKMNRAIEDVLGSPPELATRAWRSHILPSRTDAGVLFAAQGRIGYIKWSKKGLGLRSADVTTVFIADRAKTDITWARVLPGVLCISTGGRTYKFGFYRDPSAFEPEFDFVEFADSSIENLTSFFAGGWDLLTAPFKLIQVWQAWRELRNMKARSHAWREYLGR